mgnify:CR=1 FL=1
MLRPSQSVLRWHTKSIATIVIHLSIMTTSVFGGQNPRNTVKTLRDQAVKFNEIVSITTDPHCRAIQVATENLVKISYYHCPKEALATITSNSKVSAKFMIPQELGRRVHFWEQIYSRWSKNDYIIHNRVYPEVIFAVANISKLKSYRQILKGKKQVRINLGRIKNLLLSLHNKTSRIPDTFYPEKLRIINLMSHIEDSDKYLKAAQSLRAQRGQKEFFAEGIRRSGRYLPIIKKEFAKLGIPEELANIAFVESSFNYKAYSKVGATGAYQVMPAIGKKLLMINNAVDERRDPIKSGKAAAKIFKENYKITGAWPLAVTSYNHGPTGVLRGIATTGSRDIIDLIYHYHGKAFGFASRNFYCEFLGALSTLKNKKKIFPKIVEEQQILYKEIKLRRSTRISFIRKKFNITKSEIIDYNPDIFKSMIRRNGRLPKGYVLKIPVKDRDRTRGTS